jgi:hypothetical protein
MNGGNYTDKRLSAGSALILTVVLTSILAIVGVLFLLASRVETLSTSSLTDERDLNLAVDTIVSKLSNELVFDTPGVAGQEYYDYPGGRDTWLASIEPYRVVNVDGTVTYKWGQISDLTGYIRRNWGTASGVTQDVDVDPLGRDVIKEYPEINIDNNGDLEELLADADGDGIADSKWIELEDVMGSRGQKVYAAIRVIDNAGLLNANTAYEFDPNSTDILRVDGSHLYQVNLSALARSPDTISGITLKRSGMSYPTDAQLEDYERYGVWRLTDPCDDYTLFDISDELEMRYRFLVSSPAITRIENAWEETLPKTGEITGAGYTWIADKPYDASNNWGLDDWERRIAEPCDTQFDRRHLLTTCNLDRIIAADANGLAGAGMINVNFDPCEYSSDPNRQQLDQQTRNYSELYSWMTAGDFYLRCSKCMEPNLPVTTRKRMKMELAQLAVNLVDLRDRDTDVTSLNLGNLNIDDGNDFGINDFVYGLEPYPVITKVAVRIDPCDPCSNPNYYAVELFNPFNANVDNRDFSFSLAVTDAGVNVDPCDPNTFIGLIPLPGVVLPPGEYMVIYNEPNAPFFIVDPNVEPNAVTQSPLLRLSSGYVVSYDTDGNPIVDPNAVDAHNVRVIRAIQARLDDVNTAPRYINVDRQLIYRDWVRWDPNGLERFFGRDFDIEGAPWWEVVYSRAAGAGGSPILGRNDFINPLTPGPAIDISVPYGLDEDLRTIGDIARIWTIGPTDRLIDPCDADNQAASPLFDPNLLDIGPIDPNSAADVNNPNNTRFSGFNDYLRTVGEKLLFASIAKSRGIDEDEDFIRLNLADPLYTNLFQYITVFDPRTDGIDNDGDGIGRGSQIDEKELKVPGRINVNTAPAYVIEQLPWMTDDIAKAIVDYRDRRGIYDVNDTRYDLLKSELSRQLGYQVWRNYIREERGFASIGELNLVANRGRPDSIWEYGIDNFALTGYPDLTRNSDLAADVDDFEERDVIFARISNLVTVRSDVFTAYILVRLGRDGPQKRVAAVLDRSDVYSNNDKVKIIALHPVSYPEIKER